MTARARWNRPAYRRLTRLTHQAGMLIATFKDGDVVTLAAERVLPDRVQQAVDWSTLHFDLREPYEFSVLAGHERIEIPSYRIRVLTDDAFQADWEQRERAIAPPLRAG